MSFLHDSWNTDLPNPLCSNSQYFYDDSESTGHDLSQLMDLPLTEQSEDDSQWQSVNDIVGQLPVDQTGLSFSDAETQFPVNGMSSVLNGESFSDAETQRPDDLQNMPVPVLRLRFPSDGESDSSDSSSHSQRLLKRRKWTSNNFSWYVNIFNISQEVNIFLFIFLFYFRQERELKKFCWDFEIYFMKQTIIVSFYQSYLFFAKIILLLNWNYQFYFILFFF